MPSNNDRVQTFNDDGDLIEERKIDEMPAEELRRVLRIAARTIEVLQEQFKEEELRRHAMQELAAVCLARLGGSIEFGVEEYLRSYQSGIESVAGKDGATVFRLLQPPVSSCN